LAAAAAPSTQSIASAELSYASSATPPVHDTDWRSVRLPTPVSQGADPGASIWYRLTFDLPAAPKGTWAVFVRRAEEHIAFYGEGEPMPVAGDATASPSPGWNYPRYFELGSEWLHAGRNVLYARVGPSSVGEHQLSVVMLGPASE